MHTSELVLEKLGEAEYMEKFPLAEELTPWVVDLEPGDAYAQLHRPVILGTYANERLSGARVGRLYIPPFWWHHVESLDACISVPLRWQIGGDRTKAVRNVGFRGWRRNRNKLREVNPHQHPDPLVKKTTRLSGVCGAQDDEDGDADKAAEGKAAAKPAVALTEDEIVLKVAKLEKREDLVALGAVSDAAAVREAVVAAEGHVGRAAIALRKAAAAAAEAAAAGPEEAVSLTPRG